MSASSCAKWSPSSSRTTARHFLAEASDTLPSDEETRARFPAASWLRTACSWLRTAARRSLMASVQRSCSSSIQATPTHFTPEIEATGATTSAGAPAAAATAGVDLAERVCTNGASEHGLSARRRPVPAVRPSVRSSTRKRPAAGSNPSTRHLRPLSEGSLARPSTTATQPTPYGYSPLLLSASEPSWGVPARGVLWRCTRSTLSRSPNASSPTCRKAWVRLERKRPCPSTRTNPLQPSWP
mmetsp:Transcript_11901/g.27901  ORF Transcript_11901/g.27901 Transcript_11901/m.27901 type:complete len:241 (-) Transcript_11901:435-1157(-)